MFRWNGVYSESKLLANHQGVFFPSTWLFSVLQKAYIISVCTQQRNYFTYLLYYQAVSQTSALMMGFNFVILKDYNIKLKLKVVFHFAHSTETLAKVWAVAW